MSYQKLSESPAFPFDWKVGPYQTGHMYPMPLAYYRWQDENMSWKETGAIFAGLTPINTAAHISGPDATRLLSEFTTSSYAKFPAGRLRHTTMCDDEGRILTHGLIVRIDENEYLAYTLTPYLNFANSKAKYDVKIEDLSFREFNFQTNGPRMLEILEEAAQEDLHDIPFMGHRTAKILGHEVRLFRMGMAGTLGYEVHGPIEAARDIYAHIVKVGEPFGLQRIGWQSYTMQLAEGGFHQDQAHFHGASRVDPGYLEFLTSIGYNIDIWPGHFILAGSSGHDYAKRFRNPFELNWKPSVQFSHEFRGKAALEKIAANPPRQSVTLIWNVDDIMDIHRSWYEKGQDPYELFLLPTDDQFVTAAPRTQFQDDVLNAKGEIVGCSSGRVYSLYSRDTTSLGVVNSEHAVVGTELTVLWGNPGSRQKKVRVKVGPFPHLQLGSNKTFDVSTIPRFKK